MFSSAPCLDQALHPYWQKDSLRNAVLYFFVIDITLTANGRDFKQGIETEKWSACSERGRNINARDASFCVAGVSTLARVIIMMKR
jgi:hypothetical protein